MDMLETSIVAVTLSIVDTISAGPDTFNTFGETLTLPTTEPLAGVPESLGTMINDCV